MKKGLFAACFFINALTLNAQNLFGNEWIKSGQPYLKLSLNQTGLYRLSYQDIKNADALFLQTNPANWQLFFRGKEVAIRVAGQQDGVLAIRIILISMGKATTVARTRCCTGPRSACTRIRRCFRMCPLIS